MNQPAPRVNKIGLLFEHKRIAYLSSFPGITEAFVVEKKALTLDADPELQYYATSYPQAAWSCQDILERILMHWDTETGVFGVKDRTFDEDEVRYEHLRGVTAHEYQELFSMQ